MFSGYYFKVRLRMINRLMDKFTKIGNDAQGSNNLVRAGIALKELFDEMTRYTTDIIPGLWKRIT